MLRQFFGVLRSGEGSFVGIRSFIGPTPCDSWLRSNKRFLGRCARCASHSYRLVGPDHDVEVHAGHAHRQSHRNHGLSDFALCREEVGT
jgi:hypothetical protein